MILFYGILIAANVFWLAVLFQFLSGLRRVEFLDEKITPASTPRVSILVPARNESRILPHTLESLLNLEYPDFEVLIIDDHSDDGTFEIAGKFASQDRRLRPMRSADLPEGWRGKTWALHQALSQAEGNWILLTDADVLHDPRVLKAAIAHAQREKLDFLSVVPHMECVTFWEKVVLPAFAVILNMVKPIYKSNDPQSHIALAAGGFILVKSIILRHLGGYQMIRDAIIEDVRLAELFKFSGYRIKTVLTESLWVKTRMYDSFHGIWDGLSRHAFEGGNYRPSRMIAAAAAILLFMPGPFVLTVVGMIAGKWMLVWLSIFPVIIMIVLQSVLNYKWKISPLYLLSFPLATTLYAAIMLNSMWNYYFRGGNLWKGRRYRIA